MCKLTQYDRSVQKKEAGRDVHTRGGSGGASMSTVSCNRVHVYQLSQIKVDTKSRIDQECRNRNKLNCDTEVPMIERAC